MFVIFLIIVITFAVSYFYLVKQSDIQIETIAIDNCYPQKQACVVNVAGSEMTISMSDKIYYLKPFYVSIRETPPSANIIMINVNFNMTNMNMGVNRSKLTLNDDVWAGKALLPICVTGRADWISEVEIQTNNSKTIFSFPISVDKQIH